MLPDLLGSLGLRPWEVGRFTLRELGQAIKGYTEAETRKWERVAWQTAHLLNIAGKQLRQSVTADKLLGRGEKVVVKDPAAEFNEFWSRVEQQREKETSE